jgi:hypothetical protein
MKTTAIDVLTELLYELGKIPSAPLSKLLTPRENLEGHHKGKRSR